MPEHTSRTPNRRSLAHKRPTPSGGFPASPVPSKLRHTSRVGTKNHDDGVASTVAARTRGGSRLLSMPESAVADRHASIGYGSVTTEYAAKGQTATVKYGLTRGAVLGKDRVHRVLATGDVPVDVWNAMQSFEPSIGWAVLTTTTTTYVWNYAKRTASASPTCYTFPHGKPSRRAPLAPFTALVSHTNTSTTGNEPGLLLVYPASGKISFWDRVGMGLLTTGGTNGSASKGKAEVGVELANGEVVTGLTKIETSGNPTITLKPFEISTRKIFIASSSSPYLFPHDTSSLGAEQGIKGVAVGEAISPVKGLVRAMTGDAVRDVWLLTGTECQRWTVGVETHKPSVNSDSEETSFAVFVLREDAMIADNLVVENVVHLDYREASTEWHGPTRPVLVAPKHGRVVFIKFPRAVVICSLAEGLPYQQVALLRDDPGNAFIGIGSILDADPTHQHTARSSAEEMAQFFTLLPQSGIVCLEASVDDLLEFAQSVDLLTGDVQLRTRLEQAVFFSDPRPGFPGSIETVALQVSESIVSSAYSDQSHLGDMAQEFEKRLHWVREIIQFIRRNRALDKVSLNARQRLAVDLKVVSSGAGLWTFLNVRGRLSMLGSGNYLSFLGDAILDWAEEHMQVVEHEDVIRAFFKHHLIALPDVLHRVRHMLQSRYESESTVAILSEWQLAVNEALLVGSKSRLSTSLLTKISFAQIAFEAALVDGMADTIETYGLDPLKAVSTRLWLTDEAVVDDLKYAYNQSVQLLQTRTGHFGSAIDDAVEAAEDDTREQQQKQQVLKDQISRMVYPLCYALEARARYAAQYVGNRGLYAITYCTVLRKILNSSEMELQPDQRGAIQYHEQYENDMQEAIVALTSINVELAYHIAEHHLHYAALVYLATNENFGSVDRLEQYMQGHIGSAQDERTLAHQAGRFARQLYSMYYNQSKPEYYHLLTDFFRRQDAPQLAWIHHANMEQLDKAGEALIQASLKETRLHGQQVMLSISKLSLIADSRKSGTNEESRAETLDYIEDRLELGAKTERMVQMIIDVARPVSSLHRNVDKEIQRYMATKCQKLGDYPYHIELYRKIAKDAMSGLVITHEDLADLLTLKDNTDGEIQDYVEAVQVCRVIPKSDGTSKNRQTACLRSLWRRIWLHDDWVAIADTSKQTDEEIQARRIGTAAFQLIQAVQSGDLPSEFMLTPQVAANMPSETELEARFGPMVDIEGLLEEQVAEAERLQSLIEQNVFTDFIDSIEA
ncbi:hypothetical protein QFC19_002759 [Naganishia cerealis]|uniref:Uncharacterized protein n=1 Tax=Naganishia cerealis TaxID=610337 RepID=A0ACC2W8V6_9TREE|nr:hypothetical protein QFC19_002759 [Naganishia cerealis]